MTKPTSLQHRVSFAVRTSENPDSPADYGNSVSDWDEQFEAQAEFVHLRGGETVMAARLEGRHAQVIRVWASEDTRAVDTDWRVTDMRTGDVFNVRDITPSDDRRWIDFLCERGVAV